MKYVLKPAILLLLGSFLIYTLSALKANEPQNSSWSRYCTGLFLKDARTFARSADELQDALQQLSGDSVSLVHAKDALAHCREAYKRTEYFMEYFFEYPVNLYNRAPVHEIEEPYMEYQAPVGLQVIEDLLYREDVFEQKKALLEQAAVVKTTAADIPATLYAFTATDEQVAESINQELIRVMTLGITGYDAPLLKSGIRESGIALTALTDILGERMGADNKDMQADSTLFYLRAASTILLAGTPFDDFDRAGLLTRYLLPAQRQLCLYLRTQYPGIGKEGAYNYSAAHLFHRDALRKQVFNNDFPGDTSAALTALGQQLFGETRLSGNNRRSCASCHKPALFFTDGLQGSTTFDERHATKRNAPGLLYSVYQYGQFQDARDSSLEKQIFTVLQNPDEMHSSLRDIERKLDDKTYRTLFRKAFPAPQHRKKITAQQVARAIAAYERTLTPFNSPFDHYMAGDATAMNTASRRGFNLFMGKALCGTCHFAPVFNGTLPPLFNRTELEVLGIPGNGDLKHPLPDTDSGRYAVFPIEFYQQAFKTPTVRNASATAPYMHNGRFGTLDDLIAFYDEGGGSGIGLEVPSQTLSGRKLHLSAQEKADIKSFIESLRDSL